MAILQQQRGGVVVKLECLLNGVFIFITVLAQVPTREVRINGGSRQRDYASEGVGGVLLLQKAPL